MAVSLNHPTNMNYYNNDMWYVKLQDLKVSFFLEKTCSLQWVIDTIPNQPVPVTGDNWHHDPLCGEG